MDSLNRPRSSSPPLAPAPMPSGSIASRARTAVPAARNARAESDEPEAATTVQWRALMTGAMTRVQMPPKPVFRALNESAMHATWDAARVSRLQQLQDIHAAPAAPAQTPKDLSVRPRYIHLRCASQVGATYSAQFARIGMREGFRTVVETHCITQFNIHHTLLGCMARVQTFTHDDDGEWAEDDGTFAYDGSISVPADIGDEEFMREAIVNARMQRMRHQSPYFGYGGNVGVHERQRFKVAMAMRLDRPLRVQMSHVEGGNLLIGVRPDGRQYALVGRDSVELTRRLIARDRDRWCSQAEALVAIAKDFGMAPGAVFPVEQPRTFHLDMAMVLMAPGQVLLQDSGDAAELEIKWRSNHASARRPQRPGSGASPLDLALHARQRRQWRQTLRGDDERAQELRSTAKLFVPFEERAMRDLQAAGLVTVLVAGRFSKYLDSINFFNGECGTNSRGERYFITQGGNCDAQAHIADTYLRKIATGLDRIYFLDAAASKESMRDWGGAACRAKVEGEPITPPVAAAA